MSFYIPHNSWALVVNEERGWLYKAPSSYFVISQLMSFYSILSSWVFLFYHSSILCLSSLSLSNSLSLSIPLHRITIDSLQRPYSMEGVGCQCDPRQRSTFGKSCPLRIHPLVQLCWLGCAKSSVLWHALRPCIVRAWSIGSPRTPWA